MKSKDILFLGAIFGLLFLPAWTPAEVQYGLPKSGQIKINHQPVPPYDLGDDGAIQAGFPLSGPRYTDNGNGTVTDNASGLLWQQKDSGSEAFGNYGGPLTWNEAFSYINAMNSQGYGGRSDWRLPNILELMSIVEYEYLNPSIDKTFFPTAREDHYWTSNSFPRYPTQEKWAIHFRGGFSQFEYTPDGNSFFVRAVAGDTFAVGSSWGIPVTGQTTSYHAGDDGDMEAGYPFSGERFTLNDDGTVQDRATGLVWQLGDSVSYRLPQYIFGVLSWEDGFGYVKQLNINNYCGHSDWRFPNIKELTSIVNYGKWVPAFWSIFTSGTATHYWSSTTNPWVSNEAFWVDFVNGVFEVWNATKSTTYYVKAVRGPEAPPVPTQPRFFIDSGDYNGDGTDDIAFFRPSSNFWSVLAVTKVYFGTGSDTPVCGDYNADGTTDIAFFRGGGGGLWSIRNMSKFYFGKAGDQPVPADYNGDGTTDAGYFRSSNKLWALSNISRLYFGASGDALVPGDYNGDGSKEPAIFRPSSGLWLAKDATRFYLGSSGDQPVPGDYEGDRTWEAAFFRSSNGLWALRNVTRFYFGAGTNQPVPADYSGDEADDAAIFRDSNGLWSVRNITKIYFGKQSDIPLVR